MTHTQETKATLIATQGKRTAWEYRGEVYICETEPNFATTNYPVNSRWECSTGHWRTFFATVHATYGWETAR